MLISFFLYLVIWMTNATKSFINLETISVSSSITAVKTCPNLDGLLFATLNNQLHIWQSNGILSSFNLHHQLPVKRIICIQGNITSELYLYIFNDNGFGQIWKVLQSILSPKQLQFYSIFFSNQINNQAISFQFEQVNKTCTEQVNQLFQSKTELKSKVTMYACSRSNRIFGADQTYIVSKGQNGEDHVNIILRLNLEDYSIIILVCIVVCLALCLFNWLFGYQNQCNQDCYYLGQQLFWGFNERNYAALQNSLER